MPTHPHSTDPLRPARPASGAPWLLIAVMVLLAGAAAWWFLLRPARMAPSPLKPPAVVSAPQVVEPLPAAPEPTGPQNLIEELDAEDEAAAVPLPALAESDSYFSDALAELVGKARVGEFLLTDGLVRRAVATVDNLARDQAPPRMWPVQPMPGRFTVDGAQNNVQTIAPANASRYSAALGFAEAVPMAPLVALYRRSYPLFQQAYEELGYPGRYFNDRLVAVLDHLLQTPEPQSPIAVQLTPVRTDVPNTRPWVRYEFADPKLEALSSGQKILLRMGSDNRVRAKAVLRDLRGRVAPGTGAR